MTVGRVPLITRRALLAIALLVGVYVTWLIGIVVLAGIVVGFVLLAVVLYSGHGGGLVGYSIGFAFGAAVALAGLVRGTILIGRASRKQQRNSGSVKISDADSPEVWRLVRGLAAEVGSQPPDEVRLTLQVNAAVTEQSRLFGLLPGRRCLYLGLPLLATLTVLELRALLGHEFGHYQGKHTRMGTVTYRAYLTLDNIDNSLRDTYGNLPHSRLFTALVYRGFVAYARLYARVSFAVRRQQEFEADQAAVRTAGRQAVVDALRSITALGPVWDRFVTCYLDPTSVAGYVPTDPVAVFAIMLSDAGCRRQLNELKLIDPADEPRPQFATHPSLAERLAALTTEPDTEAPIVEEERAPSTWQYPAPEILRIIRSELLPHCVDSPSAVSTQQWIDQAARALAPHPPTRLLLDAAADAQRLPRESASLNTILNALEAGHARQLAYQLAGVTIEPHNETDAPRYVGQLCEALFGVVSHGLVEAGCAHWRICWTGPSQLRIIEFGLDGVDSMSTADLNASVSGAIDHRSNVDLLRFQLTTLDLNLDRQLEAGKWAAQSTVVTIDQSPLARKIERQARRSMWVTLGAAGTFLALALVAVFVTVKPSLEPASDYSTNNYPSLIPIVPYHPFPLLSPLRVSIVVKSGDTLSELAKCYATTVSELQQINNLGSSTVIYPGEVLTLPDEDIQRAC
jgi:Zn-dependent protease with chaperone function